MSSEQNRRFFIRQLLATLGGAVVASTGLTSCSTIDEYLFEDHYDLKDQVLIIGGGLSGLQMAYALKQNKTGFRLFEGSSRFGGRVRSFQNYDLGGSLYSSENKNMQKLIKDFSLATESIDKKNFYLVDGMETLVSYLVDRVAGLMPYRNLRLKWKLVSIKKNNHSFELLFETPEGRRTYKSKRVALAIPPTQWSTVVGLLDLTEMKENLTWLSALKSENIVKAVVSLPNEARFFNRKKNILTYEADYFNVRQIYKKTKNLAWAEVDFSFPDALHSLEIEKLNEFMKTKMNINTNYSKMTTENYFDWSKTDLIGAAYFKSALPWPNQNFSNFQVIGDFATTHNPYTLEGALSSALSAADKMI